MACTSTDNIKEEIQTLETQLATSPNEETLRSLFGLYKEMASKTKEQTEKVNYLWKSGETARAVRAFGEAEEVLREIYETYPETEEAPKALFLHAFMLDEDLKQYDKAKSLYEAFLQKYPESDFTDDAQFLLKHLGKTDEEMLEFLRQQEEN
jgi:TolA-binding protein